MAARSIRWRPAFCRSRSARRPRPSAYVMDGRSLSRSPCAGAKQRNTDDAEGVVTATSDLRPAEEAIRAALRSFVGRDRADSADLLGGQGRRRAGLRSGPRGDIRSSWRRARCMVDEYRSGRRARCRPRRLRGDRRQGRLHARDRARSRAGTRHLRPRLGAAAAAVGPFRREHRRYPLESLETIGHSADIGSLCFRSGRRWPTSRRWP